MAHGASSSGETDEARGAEGRLVERARNGDRAAFGELVRLHSAVVWSAVSRALADREAARDVFQETWLRALERIADLERPERLRSWLLSIALNGVRQRLRRGGPPSGLAEEPRCAAEPGARPESRELRGRLAAALASLTRRQREVVELRVHFERSHAEIAALLGTSEESARASFCQALRRLRGLLEREERRERP